MKNITNFLGVGCVALFAMLFISSGAFAQVTAYYYVDPDNASASTAATDCISTATNNGHPTPCQLSTVLTETGTNRILIRVRRSGGTVELPAPTTALDNSKRFGAYVRGSGATVKGTLKFTGDFMIGNAGQFELDSLATVQFENVTNARIDGTTPFVVDPAPMEKNPAARLMISGTLTTASATIGALVVAEDLAVRRPSGATTAMLRIDSLTVNSGATLTVGTNEAPIDLRVPLKKSPKDDPRGILTVNGTIDGPGAVYIAHTNNAAGRGSPGNPSVVPVVPADAFFHMSSDYMPGSDGANHKDCVWITGGGEIESDLRAVAAGNICITLGNIGNITVAGSIAEASGTAVTLGNITTDVIFRNNVEVDGDVTQWNDARIVFEKNATVTGSVILEDGTLLPTTLSTGNTGAFPFGLARVGTAGDLPDGETVATSVRRGVKLASAAEEEPFTCTYRATMDEVRILDTPVVSLSVGIPAAASVAVDEDVGAVLITATLNKAHPDATTVTVPLMIDKDASTADEGDDFIDTGDNFQIQISSGTTTNTATITVTDDAVEESDETITVKLGVLDEKMVRKGATSSVTITINANDAPDGGNVFVDDGTADMQFFKSQGTGTAAAGPGFYIPGVQFQGVATIEEDLYIQSSEITNRHSARNRNNTRCAPRVIFAAKGAGKASSAIMSDIKGDLLVEEEHEHRIILLDAELGTDNVISAHNLSVDGDLFATGDPFEMESAAVVLDDGMCDSEKIFSLSDGTRLVLSDHDGHVAYGAALTLDALVTHEDLEVNGALTVETLHVADGAEVESDATNSVSVTAGLILQGELDGELGTGTGSKKLSKLVYGTRRTDLVTVGDLTSLSVYIDDGEFRLDQVTTVDNFGLCKGDVVLSEAGGENDSTLTVTKHLTVKDGNLRNDTNGGGGLAGDIKEKGKDDKEDGYILLYVTEQDRMASMEWSSHTRKVAVKNQKDAVIIVNEAKSLVEGVHLFSGHLHLKGEGSHLTIGPSDLFDDNDAGGPFLMVDNAELHSRGNNVVVHGTVKVAIDDKEAGKIVTGGGELQVLGTTTSMDLDNATAVVTVGKAGNDGGSGTIDVGAGALQLGPETTNAKDGLRGDWLYDPIGTDARPHVKLEVLKGSVMGTVRVPRGSKQTEIIGASFGTIAFDGTATPNKGTVNDGNPANWNGTLYLVGVGEAGKKSITVDSLNASNGAVEFRGTSATVNKDVAVSSSAIYQELKTLAFKGDLAISGDGGFSSRRGAAGARHSVMVGGDYSQVTTQTGGINPDDPKGGAHLSEHTDKTVTGAFMTSGTGHATRYATQGGTKLTLKGDFNFGLTAKDYMLNADLEFSGEESQMVSSAVDVGNVVVNNSAGLVLGSNVAQGGSSTLTLTRGIISGMYTWTVKNAGIEEDVRGRNNALMTCATADASCASVIKGGSRRAHASAGVARHVMYGNSGGGELSGGYLFPVGGMSGDRAHYRPLVLQLEDDLSEAMPATVTSMMASEDMTPFWPADNIMASAQGGSLILDVHADIFWKVELKEALDQNPHIRIAAGGLVNVFDATRLRMVQWDCEWNNPRLAGTQIVGMDDEDSFAENGYVSGVLNLTQESVEVGTCAILGVAANGIENPINRDEITGGLAEIQFIHNVVLRVPVDVSLDGTPVASGLTFQSATGYTMAGAGSHQVQLQPVGAPAEQAISVELPTLQADKSYAVIAHGTLVSNAVKTIETRKVSSASTMVEAILVHGSGDAPAVNVNLLDPYSNNDLERIVARQLAFDQTTKYLQLEPEFVNLQITGADNTEIAVSLLDLSGRQGEALILNLSNVAAALEVYGVDVNGDRVSSSVVTNIADAEELPTEFTLHGNYPNPFNPSTRIQFDLPESAQVSLQIVDMLGREVMTLPAKEFEAGANRSIELNAVNLASGTYLYRMIATGAESRYVKTGRMTLVK